MKAFKLIIIVLASLLMGIRCIRSDNDRRDLLRIGGVTDRSAVERLDVYCNREYYDTLFIADSTDSDSSLIYVSFKNTTLNLFVSQASDSINFRIFVKAGRAASTTSRYMAYVDALTLAEAFLDSAGLAGTGRNYIWEHTVNRNNRNNKCEDQSQLIFK